MWGWLRGAEGWKLGVWYALRHLVYGAAAVGLLLTGPGQGHPIVVSDFSVQRGQCSTSEPSKDSLRGISAARACGRDPRSSSI